MVDRIARKAIFVHGCFWHRHPGCAASTTPKTNVDFWHQKFDANVSRDRAKARALRSLGYKVVIVWECETKQVALRAKLMRKLKRLLELNADANAS